MIDSGTVAVVPDFGRRVYCLMGLPFDAITIDEAVAQVRRAAHGRQRCLLVTPNVNFVAESRREPVFRDQLLEADLSICDGMPLIWAARLLNIPLRARLTGADLFERLAQSPAEPKLSVFLFGGEQGAAELAAERLRANSLGLRVAGVMEPPVGSAEQLSEAAIIDSINASGADFLVLSLGARKAHQWIARNSAALEAPVISHLGAVIKYAAGTVARAPIWVQRLGFEWLWRIKEERSLWRRYAIDGKTFGGLFVRSLPLALRALTVRLGLASQSAANRAELTLNATGRFCTLRLSGTWSEQDSAPLRVALQRAAEKGGDIRVDLGSAGALDSAVIGLLLLLRGYCLRGGIGLQMTDVSAVAARSLRWHGAEYLIEPVSMRTEPDADAGQSGWVGRKLASSAERLD